MKSEMLMGSIIKMRANYENWGMTDYWFDDEDGNLKRFSKILNTERFTAGELPISYRVINHWDKFKLLPNPTNKKAKWRRFSILDLIWINVVIHLRDFGYSLEQIAVAKKEILKYHKAFKGYAFFEFYIFRTWFTSDDAYVILLKDGTADVGTTQEIEGNKMLQNSPQDMLLVSLKSIIESLGYKVVPPEPLIFLNKPEQEVFEKIKLEDKDEITAKFKGNKISEIHSSKTYHGKPKLGEINKDITEKAEFAEVITKYQAGVGETAKVTKKYRLEK